MTSFWQGCTEITPLNSSLNDIPASGLVAITDIGVISLRGEENKKFLQGQLTNNMELLTEEKSILSAHCDFKGKMWAIFRLLKSTDTIHLLTDKSALQGALAELKKYGVFSKTSIEDESSQYVLVGVYGEQGKAFLKSLSDIPNPNEVKKIAGGLSLCVEEGRYLLMLENTSAEQLITDAKLPLMAAEVWQLMDIRAGIPVITANTANQFVPQMTNLQALHGICFTKGCYMGQEVVARTRYLGKNKRSLFILTGSLVDNAVKVNSGDELELAIGDNWRRAGVVISAVQGTNADIALSAVLASDTTLESQIRVKGIEGSKLQIQPLPYTIEEDA